MSQSSGVRSTVISELNLFTNSYGYLVRGIKLKVISENYDSCLLNDRLSSVIPFNPLNAFSVDQVFFNQFFAHN